MINNSLVIGVASGSGSGKSTFAKRICDYFGDKAVLISCDNYYLAHDDIPLEERAKLNYDIPEAFEFDLMLKQMNVLRSGKAIDCPVYDFTVHTRSGKTIKIEPKPVIVIDGILALYDDNLRDIMDVKVFVETDADENTPQGSSRRRRKGQKHREHYRAISHHRKAHALQIYRAYQTIRRRNNKRRFQRRGFRPFQNENREFFIARRKRK